jgi:hypothetical protein
VPQFKTPALRLTLLVLAFSPHARAGIGAETSQAIREVEIDPQECYRVRDLEFRRGDVAYFLTDGYLAFSKPVNGAPVAALFSSDTEGGDAEIILLPPDRDERRILAARSGVPNLDEHLTHAAFFFADDTAGELQKQMQGNEWIHKDPAEGAELARKYTPTLRGLAPEFVTRLLLDLLSGDRTRENFFAALLEGKTLGTFQVEFDPRAPEQILAAQVKQNAGGPSFDIWTSYTPKSLRGKVRPADFHADQYRISSVIDPNLHMRVQTIFTVRDVSRELRALSFDLSQQMRVISAEVDGTPAETTESVNEPSKFLDTGDRLFVIIPSEPLRAGSEHIVKVVHEGDVITAGANHVYFVGSRGRWYPHRDLEFARFDLTFRFPKNLDLVAPGEPVRDATEGDVRVIERRSDVPLPMAGFNLGTYTRITVKRGEFTVEMCANRDIPLTPAIVPEIQVTPYGADRRSPREVGEADLPSDPNAALKNLANRIGDIMEFYAKQFGPPPLKKLIVSPIPGRFGQGFGGLIYLSTMAYMSPSGKAFTDMDVQSKVFFTELMRAHEAAHQWWGNLVMTSAYHDEWITEALANYSAMLYLEKTGESKAAGVLLEAYRQALLSKNPAGVTVESAGPVTEGRRVELDGKPGAWVTVLYGKSTWIMRMIHARMGDEAFWRMLAELRHRYERKNLTTEQFRALCAEFMPPGVPDHSLEAFFDQWVWGTGIPALKLTTSQKGNNLTGTLSQSGVEDDFSADFPVEVVTRGKTTTKWVRSSSEPVPISVPASPGGQRLELDPDNWFLKR